MHTQMRFSMATNPFRSCSELQAAKGLNTKKSCWCVQSGQLLLRQQPLFALRVTELGDGSSVLAATFLHVLADGAFCSACPQTSHLAFSGTHPSHGCDVHRVATRKGCPAMSQVCRAMHNPAGFGQSCSARLAKPEMCRSQRVQWEKRKRLDACVCVWQVCASCRR